MMVAAGLRNQERGVCFDLASAGQKISLSFSSYGFRVGRKRNPTSLTIPATNFILCLSMGSVIKAPYLLLESVGRGNASRAQKLQTPFEERKRLRPK